MHPRAFSLGGRASGAVRGRLLRDAAHDARKMLLGGLVAIPLGLLVTVLGGLIIVGFVLGPLLVLGGVILIPSGILQLAEPTRHPAIGPLGRTPQQRRAALQWIEHELADPWAVHLDLGKDGTLSITAGHIVVHGRDLAIARRDDLLWAYEKVTRRRFSVVSPRESTTLCLRTRTGSAEIATTRAAAPHALWMLERAVPHARFGWRHEWDRLSHAQLQHEVDTRRGAWSAACAR